MNKVKLKWFLLTVLSVSADICNLVLAWPYSLFTANGWPSWGRWLQTYDNPPRGDGQWLKEGWFPGITTGFKGYLNRVGWIIRNSMYTLAKEVLGLSLPEEAVLSWDGNENTSDKWAKPGFYRAVLTANHEVVGWEYYVVHPYKWWPTRCMRLRLGWKMMTKKFDKDNKAQLVHSFNPWKSYGDNVNTKR